MRRTGTKAAALRHVVKLYRMERNPARIEAMCKYAASGRVACTPKSFGRFVSEAKEAILKDLQTRKDQAFTRG